ncbi:MAG: NrtA/SsuA/CpmA family ABC transporter substrate-binding protein [Nitrospirae bacterium]|nr:NrtA/SsuA/CpmA family ABC transporter substrate-binding protein [Nitrospirota bacterium]
MSIAQIYKGLALTLLLLIVILLVAVLGLSKPPKKSSITGKNISIGISKESLAALSIIAAENGYFKSGGLNTTIKYYDSGKIALDSIISDNLDVVTVSSTPIVFHSFHRQDFSIIASIGSSDNEQRIIARKDAGIIGPKDLRGKHIATTKTSSVHFFLHLFLAKHGLSEKDVNVTFMKPDELPNALLNGDIDAFSMREPFISKTAKLLGDNSVIFEEPKLYIKYFYVVVRNDFLQRDSEAVEIVLKALLKSEDFIRGNPHQALHIVSSKLATNEMEISQILQHSDLSVRLDQSMLIGLETQARWLIRDKLVNTDKVPNYIKYISSSSLRLVKPETVNITQYK